MCQVRNIPSEDPTNPLFLTFGPGVYFLKRVQNQFKKLLEISFVLASMVSREKCEYLDGYVTTPRSISGCAKCGAWLFVQQVPFTLQEHVKTTKTDKMRFFSLKKRLNLLTDKQLFFNIPFQSTKYRKNCVWSTKYKRLLDMCIVRHVDMKSVFTFQPIKRLVPMTVKSVKPAATF